LQNAKTVPSQTARSWLQFLPVPEIVNMYGAKISGLRQWYERQQSFSGTRNGILDTFTLALSPLRRSTKRAEAFSGAAGLSTLHQVDPRKPLKQQDWVTDFGSLRAAEEQWGKIGLLGTTGMTFEQGYNAAVEAYNRMDPETKAVFADVADKLKDVRNKERKALIEKIHEITEGGDVRTREKMVKEATDSFASLRGVYFPLARFGDYYVIATDTSVPGPKGDGQFYLSAFENIGARDARLAELKGMKKADGTPRYTDVRASYNSTDPSTRTSSQQLLDKMKVKSKTLIDTYFKRELRRMGKSVDELSAEDRRIAMNAAERQVEEVMGMLTSVWMDSLPDTSAYKNSVRRGSIPGYNGDMVRSVSDYMTRHAGNLASLQHGFHLDKGLVDMENYVRAKAKAGETPDMEMAVLSHLKEHLEVSRNTPAVPLPFAAASRLASIWYMSSPSTFLVQMSQLGITALPKMASNFGMTKSIAAMGRAMSMATDARMRPNNIVKDSVARGLYERIYATATEEDVAAGKAAKVGDNLMSPREINALVAGLSESDRHALLMYTALQRNMVGTTYANETIELAQGKAHSGMMPFALFFMRKGEELSRATAVISGFDLAYQKHKDWAEALYYAQHEINTGTMFDYSKEAKPLFMIKHPFVRVASQFKYYSLSLVARISRLAVESLRGQNKAIRTQALKELSYMMGTSGVLAGALGMPLAGVMFEVVDAVVRTFGDDEDDEFFDSRTEFHNAMKENGTPDAVVRMMETGILGGVGWNLSPRIGTSDTLGLEPGFTPAHLEGAALYDYYAARLMGPSYAAGRDLFDGVNKVMDGEYMAGLEKMVPKAIKDPIRAFNFVEKDGVVTAGGKRLSEGADMWDAITLSLGIMPYDYVQPKKVERMKANISAKVAKQQQRLYNRLADAVIDNDSIAKREAVAEIAAWNAKHPSFPVYPNSTMRAIKSRVYNDKGVVTKRDVLMEKFLPK
jgi:hypothetical protein